jgi:hypothetical protein
MGVPRFFKLHKPKQFEYNPIYWDPEKEEREERIRRIKQEMGVDEEGSSMQRSSIRRGSFRQYKRNAKVRASRSSNIRLIIILAVLFLLSYLIFYR